MLQKQKHGWDRSEGVKYTISRFEEEQFQKFYENGGREKLSKRIRYFNDGKITRKKWGHWSGRSGK